MEKTLFSAKRQLSKQQIILIITLVVLILVAATIVTIPFLVWDNFSVNHVANGLIDLQADFDSYGFNVELFLFITLVIALSIVFIGIIVCIVFLIKVSIDRKHKLVIKYDSGDSEPQEGIITISDSQGENTNV